MISHSNYTILHTEASLGWGGQEIRILREALGLTQRGWNVMLACDPEGELFLNALKHNLPVIPVKFSYRNSLLVLKQLRQAIREYDIRLVHTHSSVDAWLGGIAARLSRVAVVRTRHLSTTIKGGWNAKLLYDKLADAVICTSDAAVMQLRQELPSKKTIECIATGFDENALEQALREMTSARHELGLKENEIAIGTACVLRSWKGLEEFLAAAQKMSNLNHVRFFIFGAGPGLAHYQRLAREQFPQARVTFTGHLDPVSRALAALDIFCLLSTANEGISQATLQASYLGKPLVTTDVGGLCQVCLDQETGLIVEPKNSQSVVEALQKLVADPKLREKFGQNGRELIKEHFTMDQTLDSIERILHSVFASRKA